MKEQIKTAEYKNHSYIKIGNKEIKFECNLVYIDELHIDLLSYYTFEDEHYLKVSIGSLNEKYIIFKIKNEHFIELLSSKITIADTIQLGEDMFIFNESLNTIEYVSEFTLNNTNYRNFTHNLKFNAFLESGDLRDCAIVILRNLKLNDII